MQSYELNWLHLHCLCVEHFLTIRTVTARHGHIFVVEMINFLLSHWRQKTAQRDVCVRPQHCMKMQVSIILLPKRLGKLSCFLFFWSCLCQRSGLGESQEENWKIKSTILVKIWWLSVCTDKRWLNQLNSITKRGGRGAMR